MSVNILGIMGYKLNLNYENLHCQKKNPFLYFFFVKSKSKVKGYLGFEVIKKGKLNTGDSPL